jgi:hypothetical protein
MPVPGDPRQGFDNGGGVRKCRRFFMACPARWASVSKVPTRKDFFFLSPDKEERKMIGLSILSGLSGPSGGGREKITMREEKQEKLFSSFLQD